MKKINISIFLVIIFCAVLRVDAQNYFISTVVPAETTYFNIDPVDKTQHFLNIARTKDINVETNLNFTAVSSEKWCVATVTTKDSKKVLELAVQENTGDASRTAVVRLNVKDGYSCEINVNQMGKGFNILADKDSVEIYHYNLDFSIEISNNVEFTFTLPSWIKTTDTPVLGFKEYKFSADPIDETEGKRKGDIIIKSVGDIVPQITIPVTLTHDGFVRFAVISDTHFDNGRGGGALVKIPKILKNLTSYGKLDAIFVTGDLTNGGEPTNYTQLVTVFSDAKNFTNPIDTMLFMLGNHDNYKSKENYVNGLKPLNGGKPYPYDQYIVIKGYPFITISQRASPNSDPLSSTPEATPSYPKEVVEQLDAWMAQAARECPGKPIFVFTHVPPRYGCYGTWQGEGDGTSWPTWSMWPLNPILNKYPQAVIFSGHSHFPIGDPRSIHQGVDPNSARKNFYTSINAGSSTYSEVHKPAVSEGIHPKHYEYVTEGMILTAQTNGDVKIQRYDTYRNEEMHPEKPWVLKAPHDGTAFAYADIRDKNDANPNKLTLRSGLPAPAFTSGAAVTIDEYSESSVTFTFPQATDDEYVFRYQYKVKEKGGSTVKEDFQFSYFYLNSEMPDSLTVTVTGLASGKAYTVEVIAYDSYDNKSATIVSGEFKTGAYTPPAGTSKPDASTLLLDVVFNANGTATDASSLNNTITTGTTTPTTYLNETYNVQTAKFTGSGSCFYKVDYKDNATIKDAFSNGFTFETLYKVNSNVKVSPMSAQESGGAGFEQTAAGVLQFWVRINGSWKTINASTSIQAGKYYHVVGSYDKTAKKTYIYINGVFSGELDATGDFSFPSNTSAQWIAIGGDASTGTTCQAPLDGEIVIARMYNKAVTRDEIYWMYKDYDIETPEEPQEPVSYILPQTFPESKLVGQWMFNASGIVIKDAKTGVSLTATKGSSGDLTYVEEDGLYTAQVVNSTTEANTPNYLTLTHNLPATTTGDTEVKDYCIVMDVKAALTTDYLPLLWSHSDSDADIFVKKAGSMGLSAGGLNYSANGFVQVGWNRIVINANLSDKQLDFYCMYPDGTIKNYKKTVTETKRFSLRTNSVSDIFRDNAKEHGDAHIAQYVLLNAPLTQAELDSILQAWEVK